MAALWTLERVSLGQRLNQISLSIDCGVTAVLGPSGAGKTSLLNILVGFELPDGGTVSASIDPGAHRRPLFWVPQGDGLWPHLTVHEHLSEAGCRNAVPLLAQLGLEQRLEARPDTLSRGEQARLSVARALAADAAVLVMDEPLAHVSSSQANDYWAVVRRRVEQTSASLVFATHSPGTVLAEAQRVICLDEGRLTYAGAVDDLYWRPPSEELANCLGEANWFEPEQQRRWIADNHSLTQCVRPEQLDVVPAEDGPLVVESTRFRGAVAEAYLRDSASGTLRCFWHRPAADSLWAGARVRLVTNVNRKTTKRTVEN